MKIFKSFEEEIKNIVEKCEKYTGEKIDWINVERSKNVGFNTNEEVSVKIKPKD